MGKFGDVTEVMDICIEVHKIYRFREKLVDRVKRDGRFVWRMESTRKINTHVQICPWSLIVSLLYRAENIVQQLV